LIRNVPIFANCPLVNPLPSFFYDGPISHDIAFGGLLNNGENFANRLTHSFPGDSSGARLVTAATDGETFGHHHRFGNMALSYCLYSIEKTKAAQNTIYGEYLSLYPPEFEVEIHDRSSWSCAHGVERWKSDCGCKVGMNNWQQAWRGPLREALDWLRDTSAGLFEKQMLELCADPWLARNEYIRVVLDRSQISVENFFSSCFRNPLAKEQKIKALKLLELQRHAMFMYTSCGWFFDEISGIETVQILRYAGRVIQLAREVADVELEPEFISRLEHAVGNISEYKNGAEVYKRFVKTSSISLLNVGVHFAISSIFEKFPETTNVYSYSIRTILSHEYAIGKQRLLIGRVQIRSLITWEEVDVDFTVLYFGDYNLNGGVRYHESEEVFKHMHSQLQDRFLHSDIPEVIGLMNKYFGQHNYSLWDLFKNEQGKVLNQIFESTMDVIASNFREIYEHYYPLMRIRPDIKIPLPKALAMTVEFVLTRDMTTVLENDFLDLDKLERLAVEMRRWTFTRDKENLGFVAGRRIEKLMAQFYANPHDIDLGRTIATVLRILRTLSLNLDLWKTQNYYFTMSKTIYPDMKLKSQGENAVAVDWVAGFENLGRYLKVLIE
jgi:alpha-amylase/alpha-mannosidase (GH57 family)